MLLKYSQYQRRSRLTSNGQAQRTTGGMKMLNGKGKGYRKGNKCVGSKRLAPRLLASKKEEITPMSVDPCDNSNDSGLGFDHLDFSSSRPTYVEQEYCWNDDSGKKRRYEVKVESDNANDNFTFPQPRAAQHQPAEAPICLRDRSGVTGGESGGRGSGPGKGGKTTPGHSQGVSRLGSVQLQILSQPEMQHRARYQTEGSRGAVKDRTGNGFPIVKLTGYHKPATLEVYIGTDQGRVAPHMFYQACRVSGKNSTPCLEKKVDGTILIEIEMDPTKDMTVTCDCVGILKERNVDVEHRFPEESSGRSKKKSTRCRMVFRTVITNDDGSLETLQVTSQPIICTQPPGVPEICKKSLSSCPATGGLELFILGKNFLKDTRVCFSQGEPGSDIYWESVVQPDKEFLQQSHLVCTVPAYRDEGICEMAAVRLSVRSSGRNSEPHTFFYTPLNALPMDPTTASRASAQNVMTNAVFPPRNVLLGVQWHVPIQPAPSFIQQEPTKKEREEESEMMPPPQTVPPMRRRETVSGGEAKREGGLGVGATQQPLTTHTATDNNPRLVPTLRECAPLSSLCVGTYLSPITPAPQPTSVIMEPKLPELLAENREGLSAAESLLFPPTEAGPGDERFPEIEFPPQELPVPVTELPQQLSQQLAQQLVQPLPPQLSQPLPPQLSQPLPPQLSQPLPPQLSQPLPSPLSQPMAQQLSQSMPQQLSQSMPQQLSQSMPQQMPQPIPQQLSQQLPQAFPPPFPGASTLDVKPKAEFEEELSLTALAQPKAPQKKCDEGIPLPQELTQMSENDLLSYINPSCFDQGNTSTFSHFFL